MPFDMTIPAGNSMCLHESSKKKSRSLTEQCRWESDPRGNACFMECAVRCQKHADARCHMQPGMRCMAPRRRHAA